MRDLSLQPPSLQVAFVVGVVLLQAKRLKLPRDVTTSPLTLALALTAVGTSLVVNVAFKPDILVYFLLYLGAVLGLVAVMFEVSSDCCHTAIAAVVWHVSFKAVWHVHRIGLLLTLVLELTPVETSLMVSWIALKPHTLNYL